METKSISINRKPSPFMTLVGKWWLLFFTLIMAAFFAIMQEKFLTVGNLLGVLSNACLAALAGSGLTCVMATGEIDFSTGSAMAWSSCVMMALLHNGILDNYIVAVIIGLIAGVAMGAVNALLHIKVGIPAFLATLSTSLVFKGFAYLITNGQTVYKGIWDSEAFTWVGHHYLFGIFPMPFIVLLVMGSLIMFMMEFTKIGRCMFAVGSNPNACDYIGISSRKYKFLAFLICSFMCGVSGIVQASMANGTGPLMAENFQLLTVMVTVMGGTFLKGGAFNVPGTLLAGVLVSMVSNGMIMMEAPSWMKMAVEGFMMMVSVIIVTVMRKRAERV